MWKRSFVATSVAIGGTVDEALSALGGGAEHRDQVRGTLEHLVTGLQAPSRATRATALAAAIHEVALAVERTRLQ